MVSEREEWIRTLKASEKDRWILLVLPNHSMILRIVTPNRAKMRMTFRIVMKSLISESRNASTANRNTIIPILVRMIPKRIISIVMGVFRLSFTTTRVLFVSYY